MAGRGARQVAMAVVLALGLWGASGPWALAHALTVSTGALGLSASNSESVSVGPTSNTGSVSAGPTSKTYGPTGVNQFAPSTGVLTQVDVSLESSRQQSISGTATTSNKTYTVIGQSGGATFAVPNAGTPFSALSDVSSNCTTASGASSSCSVGKSGSATTTNTVLTISDAANLAAYVGAGTFNVTRSVANVQVSGSLSSGSGTLEAANTVSWTGTVTTTYTYSKHAAPSFNSGSSQLSLAYNFGTVTQGGGLLSQAFSLFNLADSDRVKLDLDYFLGTGDTTRLSTNLAAFSDLVQGGSLGFSAFLDRSTLGTFSAIYTLFFSDQNIGAANSRCYGGASAPTGGGFPCSGFTLTLDLKGTVIAAQVPVPAGWLLLASGLAVLAGPRLVGRLRPRR
jgi:hypothetical protein